MPSAINTMSNYRYILEPYKGRSTRHRCPCCNQAAVFSQYIDTTTGEALHHLVGRCNREIHCGYHYTPRQYFQDHGLVLANNDPVSPRIRKAIIQPKPTSYIEEEVFRSSLKGYEHNNLVEYLNNLLGHKSVSPLIAQYGVGTSKHWPGATIFWQVDLHGRIRTGKIMLYDPTTGKRVKEPYNHIQWVHSVLKFPNYCLRQCLFGEHLLEGNNASVAIVESEKTAIIASVYLPQFIWLATGGLANLNPGNCRTLKGREVTLFPDMGAFDKWTSKVNELSQVTRVRISDLLEQRGTQEERNQGLDIADYFVKHPVDEFYQTSSPEVVMSTEE